MQFTKLSHNETYSRPLSEQQLALTLAVLEYVNEAYVQIAGLTRDTNLYPDNILLRQTDLAMEVGRARIGLGSETLKPIQTYFRKLLKEIDDKATRNRLQRGVRAALNIIVTDEELKTHDQNRQKAAETNKIKERNRLIADFKLALSPYLRDYGEMEIWRVKNDQCYNVKVSRSAAANALSVAKYYAALSPEDKAELRKANQPHLDRLAHKQRQLIDYAAELTVAERVSASADVFEKIKSDPQASPYLALMAIGKVMVWLEKQLAKQAASQPETPPARDTATRFASVGRRFNPDTYLFS